MPNLARTPLFTSSGLLLALLLPGLGGGCTEPSPYAGGNAFGSGTDAASMTDGPTGGTSDDPSEGSTSGSTGGPDDPGADEDTGTTGTGSDETMTGETGETDETGETGEVECEDDPSLLCVEPAPAGWTGPVAATSDPLLTQSHCGGPYPELLTTAFSGLVVPDDDCDCECGSAFGGGCSGSADVDIFSVNYALYNQVPFPQNQVSNVMSCYSSTDAITVDEGVFTALNEPLPARFRMEVQSLAASGGQCAPIVTGSAPPAEFTQRIDLCAPAELEEGCDDTVCVPQPVPPFDAAVCIWQDGIHECPAEAGYVEQTIYHRNHEDTRECSACSCSTPSGTCPDAHANLYFGANLLDTVELWPEACVLENQHEQATAIRFEAGQPDWGSCEPSQPGVDGEATPTQPVTVCCTG